MGVKPPAMTRLVTGPLGPVGTPGPTGGTGAYVYKNHDDLELEDYDSPVSVPATDEELLQQADWHEELVTLRRENKQMRDEISRLNRKWWRRLHEVICRIRDYFSPYDSMLA